MVITTSIALIVNSYCTFEGGLSIGNLALKECLQLRRPSFGTFRPCASEGGACTRELNSATQFVKVFMCTSWLEIGDSASGV